MIANRIFGIVFGLANIGLFIYGALVLIMPGILVEPFLLNVYRFPEQALIEPLTPRELEVLHLISVGITNQEIAQQLVVAPGTIKAHTASIYRKLDVANRTEAVARARQLGILP